jgi:hypothetical protein
MRYLLGLLVGFVISDGVLTYLLVGNGVAHEGNPFLVPVLAGGSFLMLKVVGTILCVIILWDLYKRFPMLALISTSCFVAAYGAIVLWNFGVLLSF